IVPDLIPMHRHHWCEAGAAKGGGWTHLPAPSTTFQDLPAPTGDLPYVVHGAWVDGLVDRWMRRLGSGWFAICLVCARAPLNNSRFRFRTEVRHAAYAARVSSSREDGDGSGG